MESFDRRDCLVWIDPTCANLAVNIMRRFLRGSSPQTDSGELQELVSRSRIIRRAQIKSPLVMFSLDLGQQKRLAKREL